MGCVHRLLDSLDGGITVIHNAMLILFHFDNTVQGAVLFKLRGFVAKRVQGQFNVSGLKQDCTAVPARIVHWQTTRDDITCFYSQKYQYRADTAQRCLL